MIIFVERRDRMVLFVLPLVILGGVLLALPLVVLYAWLGVGYARFRAYVRHKGEGRPPLRGAGVVGYVASEASAMIALGWWNVRGFRGDALVTPARAKGRPVLCVHGYTQNGSNMWGIRRALERLGRPTMAVFLGLPGRSIERYADRLANAMREALAGSSDGIDVVAHSMGGVVLRLVLAKNPDLAAQVRTIVTLGSPHRGTASARGVWLPGRDVVALRRRSTLLGELPTFAETAPQADVTTVGAENDHVVYPEDTCHLPGTRQIVLRGLGHASLLTSISAIETVVEAITGTSAVPREPRALTATDDGRTPRPA